MEETGGVTSASFSAAVSSMVCLGPSLDSVQTHMEGHVVLCGRRAVFTGYSWSAVWVRGSRDIMDLSFIESTRPLRCCPLHILNYICTVCKWFNKYLKQSILFPIKGIYQAVTKDQLHYGNWRILHIQRAGEHLYSAQLWDIITFYHCYMLSHSLP